MRTGIIPFASSITPKIMHVFGYMRTSPLNYIALSVLGALHLFAYAPFLYWWLLPISISGFAWIFFHQDHWKKALKASICYFFAMYAATLYWVGHSFAYVNLSWLSPIAYVGLPLVMMVPMAFFSTLAWCLGRKQSPLIQSIVLATCMNTVFLGHFLSEFAFPWVLPGYTLPLSLMQSTAWIGIEGITYLTVFAALILFARSKAYAIGIILLFVGLAIFGVNRLSEHSFETAYNFRLIQPSIPQQTKWDPLHTQKNLQRQGDLSQLEGERPIQAVIWPEAAVTFDFTRYPELQKMLGHAAPNGGYVFLGTVREEITKQKEHLPHNSLVALNDAGVIKGIYDKKHLLPFGEYMPFRAFFPFLTKITHGARDFVPGKLRRPWGWGSYDDSSVIWYLDNIPPFRVLICYEAMFSREILYKQERRLGKPSGSWIKKDGHCLEENTKWLLNITNDAWFGDSVGPHQHLYHSSVRAIEQGLPMVRCANNGISAVIDPYGRILYRLELNDIGIIDFTLPEALLPTFYSHHGIWILPALLLLNMSLLTYFLLRRRRSGSR